MKRTTNAGVVRAWKSGDKARNSRHSLYTDGVTLWSYELQIGMRTASGCTVLADYRAGTDAYKSQTTSCHVGLAEREGVTMVMHPLVWRCSPLKDAGIPF